MIWLRVLHRFQILLLYGFYAIGFIRINRRVKNFDWVIGPNEIAGVSRSISSAVPNSKLINLTPDKFFSSTDQKPSPAPKLWQTPKILARLAHDCRGFVYVGSSGYLLSSVDERSAEFRFLKRINRKIVAVLVGSDIRSVKAMNKESSRTGAESIADYIALQNPFFASDQHEEIIVRRCSVINQFADQIFSVPRDQMSYLRSDSIPLQVFLPIHIFSDSEDKFMNTKVPIILHAPSSPFIKGTPLVRAAIARLRSEGFMFDYQEFSSASNEDLLTSLRSAHIVLNEFYAFVPGMLGIEALASKCVLITRASKELEPTLPGDPTQAWIPTEPYEIYDKLANLLRDPDSWLDQARKGFNWALEFAAENSQGKEFARTIGKLL